MAKGLSIGATLVLREGNFFANAKKAVDQTSKIKSSFLNSSKAINNHSKSWDSLGSKLKTVVGAYLSVSSAINAIKFSDELLSTTARINNINDGLQTTAELNAMIYDAAEASRSPYQATADLVTRLGANAGTAFKNTEEMVKFAEQLNKRFVIAGASATEASNATLQLSQGLAAGALRGDELNSVLEQAPNIARSIEKYMRISEGSIKTVASQGLVTADVVKNAILNSTEETNAQFEAMPVTFSQIWTDIKNKMREGIAPLIEEHIPRITEALSGFTEKIPEVFGHIIEIAKTAGDAIAWVKDNWNWLLPVIAGVVGAVLAAKTVFTIITIAIQIWTLAQTALNIAMSANVIGLIIIGVVVLIGVLVGLAVKFQVVRDIFLVVWDVIKTYWKLLWDSVVAVFQFAWELIKTTFSTVFNVIINIHKMFTAVFMGDWKGAWEACKNVFKSIWDGIKSYFKGAINFVINIINALIRALNKIHFDVPEWLGGGSIGFSFPEIPMLASGGIIRSPGSVLVGERGPEILNLGRGASVIPLDRAGSGGTTNHNAFHITIQTNELDDAAIDRFIGKVKFAMANM